MLEPATRTIDKFYEYTATIRENTRTSGYHDISASSHLYAPKYILVLAPRSTSSLGRKKTQVVTLTTTTTEYSDPSLLAPIRVGKAA